MTNIEKRHNYTNDKPEGYETCYDLRKTFLDPRLAVYEKSRFFERIKKRRREIYDSVFYVIMKREEYARTTMLIGNWNGNSDIRIVEEYLISEEDLQKF